MSVRQDQDSGLLLFVVVQRLPEADPDIEQAQAAADAAEEAVGDDAAQAGKREQQVVVGPLRGPGRMMRSTPATALIRTKRKTEMRCIQSWMPVGAAAEAVARADREVRSECWRRTLVPAALEEVETGVGSVMLCRPPAGDYSETGSPAARMNPERRKLGTESIGLFYDFRALMRSETSR